MDTKHNLNRVKEQSLVLFFWMILKFLHHSQRQTANAERQQVTS